MSSALVTGGAGFIGAHLVRALLEEGLAVRVLDDLSTGDRRNLNGLDVDLTVADIREAGSTDEAVRGSDWVFHLAAMVSPAASMEDPASCYEVNMMGSLNVLEAARRHHVSRVVLSSSCAVYGNLEGPASESMDARPLSPYASSKLAMETTAELYARAFGVSTVCLRYFNVFGPGQSTDSEYAAVIPQFIERMSRGEAAVIDGDGKQTRDFVFVDDVVRANLLAAEAAPELGGAINIGSGASHSIRELARVLRELIPDAPAPVSGPPRAGDIRHSVSDLTRAKDKLAYRPEVTFEAGLKRAVDAWRAERS